MQMSTESEAKRKTISDPVGKETLDRLRELDNAQSDMGRRLLEVEQERMRILSGAHQLDTQKTRIFETILVERGLSPNARVSLDPETGILELIPQSALDQAAAAAQSLDS
jgi:hypothetical protein